MNKEQIIEKLRNKEIDMNDNVITMEDIKGLTREEVVQILEDHGVITDMALEYGEPGYEEDDGKNILFGDWNYISNEVWEWLEEEYNLEWSDEWIVNYNDSVAFRTQPDTYGWSQAFFLSEELEPIPIKGNEEEYIEKGGFVNNCHAVVENVSEEKMEELGFTKITQEDHCSGWYSYCEDPCDFIEKNIPQELIDSGKLEYVFYSEGKGQFSINWSVWVRADEEILEKLELKKDNNNEK